MEVSNLAHHEPRIVNTLQNIAVELSEVSNGGTRPLGGRVSSRPSGFSVAQLT